MHVKKTKFDEQVQGIETDETNIVGWSRTIITMELFRIIIVRGRSIGRSLNTLISGVGFFFSTTKLYIDRDNHRGVLETKIARRLCVNCTYSLMTPRVATLTMRQFSDNDKRCRKRRIDKHRAPAERTHSLNRYSVVPRAFRVSPRVTCAVIYYRDCRSQVTSSVRTTVIQ